MICVPIMARDTREALDKIAAANSAADAMEFRLDVMRSFGLEEMFAHAAKPVIVTWRSRREGGLGNADFRSVSRLLLKAARLGADFLDVEYRMPPEYRRDVFRMRGQSRVISSLHIMRDTPGGNELERTLERMSAAGADVVKIVTRATAPEDNLRVLGLIPKARRMGVEIVAFCMGPLGRVSRVASVALGAYLTFACLGQGEESADGQIPASDMRRLMEGVRG
jgi:3-dehydroquinate dehydratase type I